MLTRDESRMVLDGCLEGSDFPKFEEVLFIYANLGGDAIFYLEKAVEKVSFQIFGRELYKLVRFMVCET